MAQQQPRAAGSRVTLAWVVMLAAAACFIVAALSAGLHWSTPMWAWGFGGFAGVALSWALAGLIVALPGARRRSAG
jgi:hypothetical protein